MYISLYPFLFTVLKILLQFWIKMSEEEQNVVKYRKHKKTGLIFSFGILKIIITSVSHITGQEGAVSQNTTEVKKKTTHQERSAFFMLPAQLLCQWTCWRIQCSLGIFFHFTCLMCQPLTTSYLHKNTKLIWKLWQCLPKKKKSTPVLAQNFYCYWLKKKKKNHNPPTYCVLHAANT